MAFLVDSNLDNELLLQMKDFLSNTHTPNMVSVTESNDLNTGPASTNPNPLPAVELATTNDGGPGIRCAEASGIASTARQSNPSLINSGHGILSSAFVKLFQQKF